MINISWRITEVEERVLYGDLPDGGRAVRVAEGVGKCVGAGKGLARCVNEVVAEPGDDAFRALREAIHGERIAVGVAVVCEDGNGEDFLGADGDLVRDGERCAV